MTGVNNGWNKQTNSYKSWDLQKDKSLKDSTQFVRSSSMKTKWLPKRFLFVMVWLLWEPERMVKAARNPLSTSTSPLVPFKSKPDANLSPAIADKSFGFLDDTGTGNARMVETTSSGIPLLESELSDNTNNNDLDSQHQISWKNSKRNRVRGISHKKASLLTTLLVIVWSPVVMTKLAGISTNTIVVRCLVVILYLSECATCSTRRYLSNCLSPREFDTYLQTMQTAAPRITWHVDCYHWRQVRQRDPRTGRITSTPREKIITHRAIREFPFHRYVSCVVANMRSVHTMVFRAGLLGILPLTWPFLTRLLQNSKKRWKDTTLRSSLDQAIQLGGDAMSNLFPTENNSFVTFVKTTVSRLFLLSNPAVQSRYLMDEAMFISTERRYDRHYDFYRRLHLNTTTNNINTGSGTLLGTNTTTNGDADDVKFRHKLLVVRTGLSDIALASQMWFWVASFLGLTVPYRLWFSYHCRSAELTLTKSIDS